MKAMQEQNRRISENLKQIKNRIVVFSGKGGVGKTTVAVNLAFILNKYQLKTGLLDADITGPNVAKMTGIKGMPKVDADKRIHPHERDGVAVISMATMLPDHEAVIWRGPLRSGVIAQFLADVLWGERDVLLADLPPGTGDEVLTAAQKMFPQMAVIVTTPQEVSLLDCRRAITMAAKLNIKTIGVVENMAGFVCPRCGEEYAPFGTGGGERLARETGSHFLGRIPMDISVRESGDSGLPVVISSPDSLVSQSFRTIGSSVRHLLHL